MQTRRRQSVVQTVTMKSPVSLWILFLICLVKKCEGEGTSVAPGPKIRIVLQHLILFEDDRRRSEPAIVSISENLVNNSNEDEDSRQESTLEVVSDTPNSTVVLEEKLYQESVVHLECAAPYRVEWVYEGEGYPDPVLTFLESKRNSVNYSDLSSYTYTSKLDLITLNERNTGRYTCRSVEVGQGAEAYFYIYVSGKRVFVAELPAVKSKVTPPPPNSGASEEFSLLLPCTVSNPRIQLSLYKLDKKSSYITEIKSATFDPSRGFQFKSPTPWGIYVCMTKDKKKLIMAFAKPNRSIPPGATALRPQFSYNAQLNSFLCCSDATAVQEGVRPEMRFVACSSRAECQIRKHGPAHQIGQPLDESLTKNQLCSAMHVNETNSSDRTGHPGTGSYRFLTATRERSSHIGPAGGMFQCRIGNQVDDFYFAWRNSKLGAEPLLDLDQVTAASSTEGYSEFTTIRLKSSAPFTRGVPVRVECNYNSFLFTKGHVWIFGYKNGTTAIADKEYIATNHYYIEPHEGAVEDNQSGTPFSGSGGLREYTTIAFPDSEITSLICSVPIAKSATGWQNVSVPVTVKDK